MSLCVCVLPVLQVKLCVFFTRLCAILALCWMFRSGSVKGLLSVTREGTFAEPGSLCKFCVSFSLSVCVLSVLHFKLCVVCFCVFMRCAILRICATNRVVGDSYCRGGIVHIRFDFSCALSVRRHCSKALWRFRASISNSLSGRSWLHTHTPIRYIHNPFARQDIRVCGDDHFEPPMRQYHNTKALWLLRVSI